MGNILAEEEIAVVIERLPRDASGDVYISLQATNIGWCTLKRA